MVTDIECSIERLLCWICHLTRDEQDFLVYLHIVLAKSRLLHGWQVRRQGVESRAVRSHCLIDLTQLLSETDKTFGAYGEDEV